MKLLRHTKNVLLVLLLLTALLLTACEDKNKIEENFYLSQTELQLRLQQSVSLFLVDKGDEVGDYTVEWESDDSAVAVVSGGTVVAIGTGSCCIHATVTAGEQTATYSCSVVVVEDNSSLTSVSFAAGVYALGDGQTLNLNNELVFYPSDAQNKSVTWKSSNPEIATVADGIVTPVTEGIATITATTADGGLVASCVIQVSGILVDPTSITLSNSSITLEEGKTQLLTATIAPENASGFSVLWTSSDPTVATVSNGAVSAVSEGTATITAKINLGDANLTAKCTVKVTKNDNRITATRVTLTPSSVSLDIADSSAHRFTAVVSPADCSDTPIWSVNRTDLVNINPQTGEFVLTGAPVGDDPVAVIVTCAVGKISATAVIYIIPPEPELVFDEENPVIYDRAPLNEGLLSVAITTTNELPEVTWTSSDPTIVTVDENGNIVGLKEGQVTITATCTLKEKQLTATTTVTVEKAPYLTVKAGETVAIDPALLPADPEMTYPESIVKIDLAAMTLTGVTETAGEPCYVVGFSKSNPSQFFSIAVYVLPGDPSTDTSTDASTDSSTDSGEGTSTDSGTPSDTNTGTTTDTGTSTDTNTDVSTDTGASTDTDTGASTDSGTPSDTDTNASTDTDTGASTDSGTPTDTNVSTDSGTTTDSVSDTNTNVSTDSATDSTDTVVSTDTETPSDTATVTDTNTVASTDTATVTDTNTATDTATVTDTAVTDTTADSSDSQSAE
ncbi:MAG: Ig-like domain-containing protein [Clostridia bacterium]|nr:Ig-like domain-containing protein [Clostridia bacterium]